MRLLIRLFELVANAYPEEFRAACGAEMNLAAEQAVREMVRRRGWRRSIGPLLGLFLDLAARLPAEHWAAFRQDARLALRLMRRAPITTAAAALSLGIGMSSVSGTFSLFDQVVLRPVPQTADPGQLVRLSGAVSYKDYEHYRESSRTLSSLSAFVAPVPFVVRHGKESSRVWGHIVTPDYFATLGTPMHSGTSRLGAAPPSAVISHSLWRRMFGGSQSVLGSSVSINGHAVTIAGVAAPGFAGAAPLMSTADLFLPVTAQAQIAPELANGALTDPAVAAFQAVGRLASGATSGQAQAELEALARALERSRGDAAAARNRANRIRLVPGGRLIPVSDRDLPVLLSFPLILNGLTMWIACASVAHMLLARTAGRRRELAVRLSLGASRSRLLRQLVTETVFVALLGGLFALALTVWSAASMRDLLAMFPGNVNLSMPVDANVVLFTLVLALATGALLGFAQATQLAGSGVGAALKAGSDSGLRKFKVFGSRNTLVLQQVAASLVVLLLTAWVAIGFRRVSAIELGYDTRNLHLMSLDPRRDGYDSAGARRLFDGIVERLEREPGIASAGLAHTQPLTGIGALQRVTQIKGDERIALRGARVEVVGPGLLETAGIALVSGQKFAPDVWTAGTPQVVVNRRMAVALAADGGAAGSVIEIRGKRYAVAGVVNDIRSAYLFDPLQPTVYRPIDAAAVEQPSAEGMTLVVRADPGVDVAAVVRRVLSRAGETVTVFNATTLDQQLQRTQWLIQYTVAVYSILGLFGLVLAVTGLAGVTAYAVARRRREIGIRMALGARPAEVVRMVMREGMWLVAGGTAVGAALTFAIARLLNAHVERLSSVIQLSLTDPLLSIGGPLLLGAVSLMACWIPARRSASIDPSQALRSE